ncbi:MAG: M16 family metallopeptidase [Bacillota bacterium]
MKKKLRLVAFLYILILATVSVRAEQTYETGNGMLLVGQPDASRDMIAFSLIIKAGYANEPADKKGVALLTSEYFREIMQSYMDTYIETYTFNEYTVFRGLIPATEAKKDKLVNGIFSVYEYADIALHFDLFLLVKNQMELDSDDSIHVGLDRFWREFYGEPHPYYHPITKENIGRLTADDMVNFYLQWYCPSRSVLSLGGKYLTGNQSLTNYGSALGFILEKEKKEVQKAKVDMVSPTAGKSINIDGRENVGAIVYGFAGPQLDTDEFYAMRVIDEYLNGMSGELYKKLRHETGLTYAAEFYYDPFGYRYAPFSTVILKIMPADMDLAAQAIDSIILEIQGNGIPEARFNEIMGSLRKRREVWSKDPMYDTYQRGLYHAFHWDYLNNDRYYEKLQKTTMEQIKQVAVKYFKNGLLIKVMPAKDK